MESGGIDGKRLAAGVCMTMSAQSCPVHENLLRSYFFRSGAGAQQRCQKIQKIAAKRVHCTGKPKLAGAEKPKLTTEVTASRTGDTDTLEGVKSTYLI